MNEVYILPVISLVISIIALALAVANWWFS